MDELVNSAFTEAQKSFVHHNRGISQLIKALEEDERLFKKLFVIAINRILVVFKREPVVARLVEFTAKVVIATNDGFIEFILKYLLSRAIAKDKAVRFRSCQLCGLILSKLPDDAELSADIFEIVTDVMMVRLKDTIALVRVAAIEALSRIQDPADPDNDICREFLRLLQTDPSSDVRLAVLRNIGITQLTKPYLLARSKDTSDDVRIALYTIFKENVSIKALSIKQRVALISVGLADRNEKVKAAAVALLTDSWLKQSGGDVIKLLTLFDVENFPDEAEKLVVALIEHASFRDQDLPPYHLPISPEQALFWRIIAEKRGENSGYLLDTVEFVSYIEESIKNPFVTQQFLKLCMCLDLHDEVGIRKLDSLLLNMLSSTTIVSNELVPTIMSLLRYIHRDENEHIRVVLQLIADLKDPLDAKETEEDMEKRLKSESMLNELSTELTQLIAQKAICVEEEDFEGAAKLKKKIFEVNDILEALEDTVNSFSRDDEQSWLRMLAIVCELLAYSKKGIKHTGMATLFKNCIEPAIINTLVVVRDAAIRALGLYSLFDINIAREHLLLFVHVLRNDQEEIQLTAMKSLFDILCMFPSIELDSALSSESLASILVEFSASEETSLRTTAVQGFSKLFLVQHFDDVEIMCRMLILFFSPSTEDDLDLRQCLSVFFPAYVSTASSSNNHNRLLEACFMPTITTILQAPKSSPLSQISVLRVSQFLVYLLNDNTGEISTIHERIGFDLCNFFLSMLVDDLGSTSQHRSICTLISQLNFSAENQHNIKSFRVLMDKIEDVCSDKIALKTISKIQANLKQLDTTPDELDVDIEQKDDRVADYIDKLRESEASNAISKKKLGARNKATVEKSKPVKKKLSRRVQPIESSSSSSESESESYDES